MQTQTLCIPNLVKPCIKIIKQNQIFDQIKYVDYVWKHVCMYQTFSLLKYRKSKYALHLNFVLRISTLKIKATDFYNVCPRWHELQHFPTPWEKKNCIFHIQIYIAIRYTHCLLWCEISTKSFKYLLLGTN